MINTDPYITAVLSTVGTFIQQNPITIGTLAYLMVAWSKRTQSKTVRAVIGWVIDRFKKRGK